MKHQVEIIRRVVERATLEIEAKTPEAARWKAAQLLHDGEVDGWEYVFPPEENVRVLPQ